MLNLVRRALAEWRKLGLRHRLTKRVRDERWVKQLIKLKIPVDEVIGRPEGIVYFNRLKLEMGFHDTAFEILKQYQCLIELVEKSAASLTWETDASEVLVRIGGETYPVHLGEEIYILYEIYVRADYNLRISDQALLIDVGANVGYTTIFLASRNPNVSIVAFEPLENNYLRAKKNIALNAHLSNSIELHNYGLSIADADVEIQSVSNNPGRSSIVIDRSSDPTGEVHKYQVKVKNAGVVINSLIQEYAEKDIWVKMDCEGSEYDIVRSLASAKLLSKIKGFIFEWHVVGIQNEVSQLADLLHQNEFSVYLRSEFDQSAVDGMCLAIR